MSNIEPIIDIIIFFFPLVISILIALSALALRSLWPRYTFSIEDYYSFKKGKTEYFDPSRPHSNIYHDYLKLALMTTTHRQQEFASLVSRLIKEHINEKDQITRLEYSENLSNLLSNPKLWLQSKYTPLALPIRPRKTSAFEILYQEYVEIFTEVENILDIQILPKME
ncbi:MAG: hypothetical protein ACFFAU_04900 [Candidatus Hodarchaeota archaeon]